MQSGRKCDFFKRNSFSKVVVLLIIDRPCVVTLLGSISKIKANLFLEPGHLFIVNSESLKTRNQTDWRFLGLVMADTGLRSV